MDRFVVRLKRKNEESVDDAVRQQHEVGKSVASAVTESTVTSSSDERVKPLVSQNQEGNINNSKNREYTIQKYMYFYP